MQARKHYNKIDNYIFPYSQSICMASFFSLVVITYFPLSPSRYYTYLNGCLNLDRSFFTNYLGYSFNHHQYVHSWIPLTEIVHSVWAERASERRPNVKCDLLCFYTYIRSASSVSVNVTTVFRGERKRWKGRPNIWRWVAGSSMWGIKPTESGGS